MVDAFHFIAYIPVHVFQKRGGKEKEITTKTYIVMCVDWWVNFWKQNFKLSKKKKIKMKNRKKERNKPEMAWHVSPIWTLILPIATFYIITPFLTATTPTTLPPDHPTPITQSMCYHEYHCLLYHFVAMSFHQWVASHYCCGTPITISTPHHHYHQHFYIHCHLCQHSPWPPHQVYGIQYTNLASSFFLFFFFF